jgi:mannose/fructose/N-acetylgalactosamine-specific phosphotransferase system component IIB
VETFIPISNVNVIVNGLTTQTDTLGHVTVADSCKTMLLSHVNYENRLINLEEVSDTVFLISKLLNMKEVVVFGKAKYRDDIKELRKKLRLQKTEAELLAADPSSGFNFLPLLGKLIPKKWKKNTKKARRERLKSILDDY